MLVSSLVVVSLLIAAQPDDVIITPPQANPIDPSMLLVKAEFIPDDNVSLDGTNYWTLTLKTLAGVALSTPISSEATAYTKGVPSAIALLTTVDQHVLNDASIVAAVAKTNTGMDIAGRLRLSFERARV